MNQKLRQPHLKGFVYGFVLSLAIGLQPVQAKAAAPADPGIFDQQCRMKAKEQAAETYRGCVTENRKAHLDQIKSEYQAKLKSLKEEYTQELQKLSGGTPTNGGAAVSKAQGKRVASKNLPGKKSKTNSSQPNSNEGEGFSMQLKADPTTAPSDESSMDLPEPIPVDGSSPQI